MPTVHLTALDCLKQQETDLLPFPGDELRLDVQLDDGEWQEGVWTRRAVRTGQGLHVGKRFTFKDWIRVRLWEIDTPPIDPDDLLGEQIISSERAGKEGYLFFGRAGGRYRLYYVWDE